MNSSTVSDVDPVDASRIEDTEVLVVFVDITNFTRISRQLDHRQTFSLISSVADMTVEITEQFGGTVVKHIGDASLLYFPEACVDEGVQALWLLKEHVDTWLAKAKLPYNSQLGVKAHFGMVARGLIGRTNSGCLDIIGETVNIAATLQGKGFVLSPQAFRKLSADSRTRFKKHTPPITYIPVNQSH